MAVYDYILIFIIGACIGSFLNVVIYRTPRELSIITPRSSCITCKNIIPWYNNIPIFSYFLLKGKCSNCKTPYSIRYPIVEFITAVIFTIIFFKFGKNLLSIYYCIYFSLLIVLSFIDFEFKAVPSSILVLTFLSSFLLSSDIISSLKDGAIVAGSIYLLNFLLTYYIQNIKSKILKDESLKNQVALGEGDIPIFATFGIILSLQGAFSAVFLAAIFAIIPSIINKLIKKDIQTPFIPYLSLGIFVEIIFEISTRI